MDRTLKSVPQASARHNDTANQLARIAVALERFVTMFESFCKAYLKARFPYGRNTDRWAS